MTVLIFVLVISSLILIHEFGHFIAAKFAGIRVEEFALGLGPRLLTIYNDGETVYTLNLLPVGGFVRLYGEDGQINPDAADLQRSYSNKPLRLRALVIVAGILMNYLLGVLLTGIVFAKLGEPVVKQTLLQVTGVTETSPAANTDVKADSVITGYKLPDQSSFTEVKTFDLFLEFINQHRGQEINLALVPAESTDFDHPLTITITPRVETPQGEGPLGVSMAEVPRVEYEHMPWWKIPYRAFVSTANLFVLMVQGLGDMFAKLFQGIVPQDVAGPIGIAKLTGEVAKTGFFQLLQFTALISLNLALLNILPFPALDGGRLAFLIAEAIFGRKVLPKYEPWIHGIGIIVLLGLMVVISYYDIQRFF